ncbi:MAG: hypothetical protein HPZ91_06980 [Lentisphaeria bacterium]|nr:hypothetical protein [Lentisphaeria bacterium]
MIIALACEENRVAERFVRAPEFAVYEVDFGRVGGRNTVRPGGNAAERFLRECGVDLVICGRIGEGSRRRLMDEGIKFFGGVSGPVERVLCAYLDGSLEAVADFDDFEEE